jgi:putative heme-binding domain-containing protein
LENGEGREFGPNLAGVAKRMNKFKIVQSVVDPNAEVAEKYRSTLIVTTDGMPTAGLVVSENDTEVELFDGKAVRKIAKADIEERVTQQQSSMPEGAPATLAPSEFVDLMEYLACTESGRRTEVVERRIRIRLHRRNPRGRSKPCDTNLIARRESL